MPADELVHLPGRRRSNTVKPPEVVGRDGRGNLIMRWFYPDCHVLLKYRGKRFRVENVVEVTDA